MSIGKCDARQILTAVRRLCGQFSTGPRRVFDQSIERISAPMSPPPTNTPSAVGAFICSDKPSIFFLIFLKKYIAYGSSSEEVSQAEPFTNLRIYPTQGDRQGREIRPYPIQRSGDRATLAVALAGIQASTLTGIQAGAFNGFFT